MGRHDKAREYIERVIKANSQSREGITLMGWNDMRTGRDALAKKAGKYFEEALKIHGNKGGNGKVWCPGKKGIVV